MGGSGRYLYAVTRDIDPACLLGVEALSGGALDVLEQDGLMAVLSTVDLDEYGEEGLHANLEQLEWLETTARTHDAVVKAVSDVGPVAPMRLATIFHDDTSVRQRLEEWYHPLVQVLDRVQGRYEWSAKVLAPAEQTADRGAQDEAPTSGAEYLRRKKEKLEQRAAHREGSDEEAQLIHAALADCSVAVRVLPAQDPRLTGHVGTMVLNAAYLVESENGAAFVDEAAACAARHPGLVVDVQGPWPPYSFAMLEQR